MESTSPHGLVPVRRSRQKSGLRRPRHGARQPISARLVLDHRLRSDVGVLSDDLIADLFPRFTGKAREHAPDVLYVAVTPWTPHQTAVEDLPWTIIPIQLEHKDQAKTGPLSHSTIHFPAEAGSVQTFVQQIQAHEPVRSALLSPRGIEIYVLDVNPVHLDTVYVTVERNLLKDVDELQRRFGGGFSARKPGVNGSWAKGRPMSPLADRSAKISGPDKDERLMEAVRRALASQPVIHAGDLLPLPLPSHPITYAPPPPATVSFCEPVAQGLLMPQTKVIIVRTRASQHQSRGSRVLPSPGRSVLQQVVEDEADDTSNETFYSAAEDKPAESTTDMDSTSPPDDSETETDASEQSMSEMSDDSLDDMITLAAPELPQQPSGVMSAMSMATPRPGGAKRFDVHTPGSVFSNYTSATARPGGPAGKTFKAECLLDRIPNEVLHPKPREDDDTDAFVFVDVHTLVKIGCFSGDWVRIEPTAEPQRNMLSSLAFGSLNNLMNNNEEPGNWRAVKVYGLPGLSPPKLRYSMKPDRRSSISQLSSQGLTPSVFVPPILLHNLQNPKYLKLSPLPFHQHPGISRTAPKAGVIRSPPVAKEVTLVRISTPISTDRSLQPAMFAALKRHFESKRRLVKGGDLIGISVDEGLGKTVFSHMKSMEASSQDEELISQLGFASDKPSNSQAPRKVGAAWFRVSNVVQTPSDDPSGAPEEDKWGGVAAIDIASTRMVQAGSEMSTIPGTLGNTWEYWLGVKSLPRRSHDQRNPQSVMGEAPKPFIPATQIRIRELISAATSPRAIQLGMKPVVILLTSTQRGIGKSYVARRACADVGVHTFTVDCYDLLAEGGANGGDVKTEAYLKARADRAFACGPNCTALLLKHIDVLTADRMVTAMKEIVADARVIIATTTDVEKVPEGIRSLFTHEMELTAPDEKEREGILRNAVADQGVKLAVDVDLSSVAVKTAALVAGDLVDVVERAVAARILRLEKLAQESSKGDKQSQVTFRDIQVAGGDAAQCVTRKDFDTAVDAARKNFADSIGAPKIPNVTWDDVGGLSNVKDAVMETIQLPLERPELFAKGMKKRSGILFYGPPGTGKTLLAKAIATEFSLNFFSVKGPELLNMYIGESEANVRRVFQRARDARPCVVFFDELDSVAPKRGNQGDSGGVMDRIVSQLLAELDGMSSGDESGGGVFVIGATNRPDLLDPALLRPGRFDKMLYLGVSDTHEKQVTILEALTRKFNLHPDVSLRRIAERLPFTYTGADLYALCSDAMLKAITRQATAVDEKIKALPGGPVTTAYFFDHLATQEDIAVMVTEEDFIAAHEELVPSVSAKELEHFERVRRTFESVDEAKKAPTANKSLTIGEAVNGVNPGEEIPDGPLSPTTNKPSKYGSLRSNKSVSSHKGKGKAVSPYPGAESDADDDVAGNGLPNGGPGKWKGKGKADGMEEENEDEYLVKTDHLVKS
ncbi:hypothetical protein VTO42DRAFT_6557 [Malbranchea cinnamomea]